MLLALRGTATQIAIKTLCNDTKSHFKILMILQAMYLQNIAFPPSQHGSSLGPMEL
jgi:hypothetical protein